MSQFKVSKLRRASDGEYLPDTVSSVPLIVPDDMEYLREYNKLVTRNGNLQLAIDPR